MNIKVLKEEIAIIESSIEYCKKAMDSLNDKEDVKILAKNLENMQVEIDDMMFILMGKGE